MAQIKVNRLVTWTKLIRFQSVVRFEVIYVILNHRLAVRRANYGMFGYGVDSIEYHFTRTQRGNTAIQIGTELFRIQKRNKNGSVRWICTNERCNASFTMVNEKIIRIQNKHDHAERLLDYHIVEVVDQFKNAVKEDFRTPIPQVYDRFVKKFRHEYGSAAEFPLFVKVKSTAYRVRNSILPRAPTAATMKTFSLPHSYTITSTNQPFLIIDCIEPSRIIAFASREGLKYLATCSTISSDGTFYTAPRHFLQSYTIQGWSEDTGMKSICFAAMQKRSAECYVKLFIALKQAANKFGFPLSFKTHLMDFETAAAKASAQVYPKAAISFCQFHFARAIWKNIRKRNLAVLSRETEIRREIANIIALPLLPSKLVRTRFNVIAKYLLKASNLFESFVKFIRRTYLNNARFTIESWNHYDHLGTRPRTNNHLEGTHRQFKTHIPHRPSIWIWIHSIQSIEESTAICIEQEEHQNRPTRPRQRKRIQRDMDLLTLKNDYEEDRIDFNEYCSQLRILSYEYLTRFDKEN